MTLPPFEAQRVVWAAPEARETLARAVTEPMLAAIDAPAAVVNEPANDWFDEPEPAISEPAIESATSPDQLSPDQSSEALAESPEEPAAEWAVEAENRDLLYGLRSSKPTPINATVSLDGLEVENRRPEWGGPTPRSVTPISLGSVYRPSIESVLPHSSMPRFDSLSSVPMLPRESAAPPAPPAPPAPSTPAAARMPTPIAFRAIPDLGTSTRRIAEALEMVAARVRRGELAVGGNVPEGDERAAMAAALAALLGVAPA